MVAGDYMLQTVFDDIVKTMERGQITIPLKMRAHLNIHKGTRMSIKLLQNNRILMETIQQDKRKKFDKFMKKALHDKTIYWTEEDTGNLRKIRKLSNQRLQRLYEDYR